MAASSSQGEMMNPAAVLHGINDLRFEDFPIAAKPGEGMVRVEIKAVGICGCALLKAADCLVAWPGCLL